MGLPYMPIRPGVVLGVNVGSPMAVPWSVWDQSSLNWSFASAAAPAVGLPIEIY